MPPAGNAETSDSRTGASSATPVAPRSRKSLAGIVEGIVSLPILAFITAVGTALLGILPLWLFALFPELRPWAPPEERRVSISDAKVAERRFTLPDDREEVTVVTFNAEVIGYAADHITVATLWIDPLTDRRVAPTLEIHGNLVSTAETNQSVGWLDVRTRRCRMASRAASSSACSCSWRRREDWISPKRADGRANGERAITGLHGYAAVRTVRGWFLRGPGACGHTRDRMSPRRGDRGTGRDRGGDHGHSPQRQP